MDRVNRILQNDTYDKYLIRIAEHEKNRSFCGHDMDHFLSVARIAYIMTLEKGFNIDKELIYAAGLLHDIGRFLQYETGEPHEQASAHLCLDILEHCGFSADEIHQVKEAIINHRNKHIRNNDDFDGIFYRADKASRACHHCDVEPECDWDAVKKNMTIDY